MYALLRLIPKVPSLSRCLRSNVKVSKNRYQLRVNVHHYSKENIVVKARPGTVCVEGCQVKTTDKGSVTRKLARSFKLPSGCEIGNTQSVLTDDGILTINIPRNTSYLLDPSEIVIAVKTPVKTEAVKPTDVPKTPGEEPKTKEEPKKPPDQKKP